MPATASDIARRMRRLPWLVGLVAALLPPLLYGAALHARLSSDADRIGEAIAAALARQAVAEPRLWPYAAPKLLAAFVRDSGAPLARVRVMTCAGAMITELRHPVAAGPQSWNGVSPGLDVIAWVAVAADASAGHRRLLWLLLVSATAGGLLGLWLQRRPLAVLRAAAAHQRGLLVALDTSQLALQASNTALSQRVAAATAENRRLTERVIAVQEAERKRIALDLHDEVGQQLTALRLSLDAAAVHAPSAALAAAVVRCEATLASLRGAVQDLRPLELDRSTLGEALRALCDRVERSSGLPVALGLSGDDLPASASSTALLRLCQEALNNAVRHAEATELALRLRVTETSIILTIRDDGVGADRATLDGGGGVAGMHERARFLSGDLEIDSGATGTCIRVCVPREVTASPSPA